MGHVALNPNSSTRQIPVATGIPRRSIQRVQFCEDMTRIQVDNPHFLYSICFSDECTFFLNGHVNRHNCRYWSDANPAIMREQHTQVPQKLNVWAGVFGINIVGPFFLPHNLTGESYLNLLEDLIYPQIVEIMENVDQIPENDFFFQQDGAPPHYTAPVRDFLDQHFPAHWIGRRGSIEWPPRSPDLPPLDIFLWGYLKGVFNKTQPNSLEDLRHRITVACGEITPVMLQNVRNSVEQRLYYCLEVNGSQFEHLLCLKLF